MGEYICIMCLHGNCENCIDIECIPFSVKETTCNCQRPNHSGEPIDNQILDPKTGAVHGPGLVVENDGTVRTVWPEPDSESS